MAGQKAFKARQQRERESRLSSVVPRVHREVSWLERAVKVKAEDDARFVFLWNPCNAAYATGHHDEEMTQASSFRRSLRTAVKLHHAGSFGYLVWREFPSRIRMLFKNEFVFKAFWKRQNGLLIAQR